MEDKELLKKIGKIYNEVMSLRKDSDFEVNPLQMDKLLDIISFFMREANTYGGKVDKPDIRPREEHGGVSATFVVFDLYGDRLTEFCDVLRNCSAMSIDATEDSEVCISVTVPNVFTRKN